MFAIICGSEYNNLNSMLYFHKKCNAINYLIKFLEKNALERNSYSAYIEGKTRYYNFDRDYIEIEQIKCEDDDDID